jgi:hypothetical protein
MVLVAENWDTAHIGLKDNSGEMVMKGWFRVVQSKISNYKIK